MSFRLKTILGIGAIEITLLAILVVSGLFYLRQSSEAELLTRAQTTAQLLSTMTSDAVVSMDLATLDALVEQTVSQNDLVYVRVRNAGGVTLSAGGDGAVLQDAFSADASVADARSDGRLDVAAPITVGGTTFGRVEIGLSIAKLDGVIAKARGWMFSIAATEIVIVALFGAALGTVLTRQLAKLRRGARRVAAGEFGHQLPVRGHDELADTTLSFNTMSSALAQFAREAKAARDRAERGRAYAESVLNDALNSMPQAVVVADANQRVRFVNRSFEARYPDAARVWAQTQDTLPPQSSDEAAGEHGCSFADLVAPTLAPHEDVDGQRRPFDMAMRLARFDDPEAHPSWRTQFDDGRTLMTSQQRMSDGGVVVVEQDITALYQALDRNRALELELMQTQKMEALGTMAGGIAHEINTPVQFIGSNLSFLEETLTELVDAVDGVLARKDDVAAALDTHLTAMDWAFAKQETPTALSEAQAGVKSIGDIVRSIKAFAHPDADTPQPHDLQALVENTLTVSRSEWKHHADVTVSVDGDVSAVACFAGKLSQVLINLIVNAAQAIAAQDRQEKGRIAITITADAAGAQISVADDGPGVPADAADKIFDLFFTTKAPGEGTGQGLAICKRIIEVTHGGRLELDAGCDVACEMTGARFVISLPAASARDDTHQSDAHRDGPHTSRPDERDGWPARASA